MITRGKIEGIKPEKMARFLILGTLVFLLIMAGTFGCKKEAEEAMEEEGTATIEEGVVEFEGMVKVAVGKYIFIPQASGFDIVIQGTLDVGDSLALVDKEIKGKGEVSAENASILVADSVEVKEAEG